MKTIQSVTCKVFCKHKSNMADGDITHWGKWVFIVTPPAYSTMLILMMKRNAELPPT